MSWKVIGILIDRGTLIPFYIFESINPIVFFKNFRAMFRDKITLEIILPPQKTTTYFR